MSQGENVRFSFRSHQDSIEVVLQGDADWVNYLRSDLGLKGADGFTRPLGVISTTPR